MNKLERKLLAVQAIALTTLSIFSYCYVDLNLTLSTNKVVLSIVNYLQQFGYYMRAESTYFYLFQIIILFAIFSINLILFYKQKLSQRYLIVSTVVSSLILTLAYPFLSSDLFNYMFDAKIITFYHQNPYTHKPLDFPQDEWLRFMRWVHRYSPYGPIWLLYSIVPSIFSFGKFLVALFLFKISIAIFHILNSIIIYKILKQYNPKLALSGTAFYSLNPLFLVEGVLNAHNDIVQAFFVLLATYLLFKSRKASSLVMIIVGALIKYIALLVLVPMVLNSFTKYKKIEHYVYFSLLVFGAFTLLFSSVRITVPFISSGSLQTQFQPWYLFWTLPLISLVPNNHKLVIASTALGLASLLRYLPFLYYGEWSKGYTVIFMQWITLFIPAITLLLLVLKRYAKNK